MSHRHKQDYGRRSQAKAIAIKREVNAVLIWAMTGFTFIAAVLVAVKL